MLGNTELPAGVRLEIVEDMAGGIATTVFDRTETYRYLLTRIWNPKLPLGCWIMLNPSTADHARTDPTLTKTVKFTAAAGCGGLAIVNLFALRSTDPRALRDHKDPVGEHNDMFIRRAVAETRGGPVIAAWGAQGPLHGRAAAVTALLASAGAALNCYGTTAETSGQQPRHPLYLGNETALRPYIPRAGG